MRRVGVTGVQAHVHVPHDNVVVSSFQRAVLGHRFAVKEQGQPYRRISTSRVRTGVKDVIINVNSTGGTLTVSTGATEVTVRLDVDETVVKARRNL